MPLLPSVTCAPRTPRLSDGPDLERLTVRPGAIRTRRKRRKYPIPIAPSMDLQPWPDFQPAKILSRYCASNSSPARRNLSARRTSAGGVHTLDSRGVWVGILVQDWRRARKRAQGQFVPPVCLQERLIFGLPHGYWRFARFPLSASGNKTP